MHRAQGLNHASFFTEANFIGKDAYMVSRELMGEKLDGNFKYELQLSFISVFKLVNEFTKELKFFHSKLFVTMPTSGAIKKS